MRPFLKWAGNKYRIIEQLKPLLPTGKRLIEPFTGTAAVFLNTDYPRYLLAEKNRDLINLYQLLQKEGDAFIQYCSELFIAKNNCEKRYYQLRRKFNRIDDPMERSALFIYLNKHGYNGLCRYNSSGGFNVPFGNYLRPYFPAKEMRSFYDKATSARFIQSDFTVTLRKARQGDVVYCDPPYAPLSKTANFTQYYQQSFDMEQQELLAQRAKQLAKRGITVIISNHDTPVIRKLYQEAELYSLNVKRSISCGRRQQVPEIIALFTPST